MALALGAGTLGLGGWALGPSWYLEVAAGDRVAYRFPVRPGETVALDYMHSMFRTPVRERFRVTEAGLELVRVGAGTPDIAWYYDFPGARLERRPEGKPAPAREEPAAGARPWYELAAPGGAALMPPARRLRVMATAVGRRTLVVGGRCLPLAGAAARAPAGAGSTAPAGSGETVVLTVGRGPRWWALAERVRWLVAQALAPVQGGHGAAARPASPAGRATGPGGGNGGGTRTGRGTGADAGNGGGSVGEGGESLCLMAP